MVLMQKLPSTAKAAAYPTMSTHHMARDLSLTLTLLSARGDGLRAWQRGQFQCRDLHYQARVGV
jgi:hypothetical protein